MHPGLHDFLSKVRKNTANTLHLRLYQQILRLRSDQSFKLLNQHRNLSIFSYVFEDFSSSNIARTPNSIRLTGAPNSLVNRTFTGKLNSSKIRQLEVHDGAQREPSLQALRKRLRVSVQTSRLPRAELCGPLH